MTGEEKFLASYIETAFWSSTDENGTALDSLDAELSAEARERMQRDCAQFSQRITGLIDPFTSEYPIAHDFWLTRNRHGAGFWDGDYPKELGKQLTDIAHGFGECDLYIGDDGLLYMM